MKNFSVLSTHNSFNLQMLFDLQNNVNVNILSLSLTHALIMNTRKTTFLSFLRIRVHRIRCRRKSKVKSKSQEICIKEIHTFVHDMFVFGVIY